MSNRAVVLRCPSSRHADVVYDVTVDETGEYACECPGYGFRRACRHVTTAAALQVRPLREARQVAA